MSLLNLKDRPIRSKLMILIMSAVLSAISLLGVIFVVYEYFSQQKSMVQEYTTTARIIANQSEAALLFQDIPGLKENLSSLQVKNHVLAGCLYDKTSLLTNYKAHKEVADCPESLPVEGSSFSLNQYTHSEPVLVDGELVGLLHIRVSMSQLYHQLGIYVLLVLGFITLIAMLAFLLSRYLQEYIARPLLNLTDVANEISRSHNYALKAKRESSDEIGELVDAFNSMLITIKSQNERITNNAAELDRKVRERTRELAESNRELEVANQELEAFSYSVSHDLRAPLRAIDGFTQALEEDYGDELDPLAQNYIKRARGAAQKMGGLISTLLQLSRVSRKELEIVQVDLTALAQKVCINLRESEPDRQVTVDIHPDMRIDADSMLMEVALNNLIGNAWKYTGRENEAHIEIGAFEQGNKTVYFIMDNGAGFNRRYASDLFTAFKRLHTDDEFEGTGIGLATVARVIHRHHGEIWATSEIDEGACFFFTINGSRPKDLPSDT